MAALQAYSPRLLLEWEGRFDSAIHQTLPGTLVFADVSGFTKLSEKLERAGRVGAEQMAAIINGLFGDLLMLAAERGGEMLKYGGDAMLLFFSDEDHALRAAAACVDMQNRLRQIGRVDTGNGIVRLRMSIGAHSGSFDLFVGGRLHRELVVAGPDTTVTIAMEAAASAGETLVSPAMARLLPPRNIGAGKQGGFLVVGRPRAPLVNTIAFSGAGVDPGRFLDRRLAQHLSAEVLHPEHRLATVSFLQFLELDPVLRSGRASEAAQRVDDVLTLVQQCFEEYGVTFLATDLAANGFKVMAIAGAPLAHGDDDERMLRAARAILDAGPAFPVRIGVNRGHVFVGDVGPSFRRTFTALGDVTNTAARVMGKAGEGECLALGPVLGAATSLWSCEPLEPFLAKGKTEPLLPWLVGTPGERQSRASATPLIGRESELATLLKELKASCDGVRTIDVIGEPGLGKSRLVAELAAYAREEGRPVVTVRCDPFSSASPYRALGAVVSALAELSDRQTLSEYVTAHLPALLEELPLIGLALGLDLPATPTTSALDDAALPERIAVASASLLAALLPVASLLVVEDAHWIDQSSIPVLEALRTLRGAGGLLLCATRRDGQGWVPANPDSTLTLGGLDAEAALALVEMTTTRPLFPDEARRLADHAAGNPLFIEQLAAAPAGGELPDSLEEVIAARIDQLPVDARDVLRRLAVLGSVFDAALVPAVVTESLPVSLRTFFTAAGGKRHFAHALVQQTAYGGLSFSRRRELHGQVAAHLVRAGAAEKHVEELSLHCTEAALWPETWRYARSAARAAETRYAFGIAAVHWERAARAGRLAEGVAATEIADTWLACGEACRRAGHASDAERAFRSGRKVAPPASPQAIGLAVAVGRALLLAGRVKAADRWARRARRELLHLDDPRFDLEARVEEIRVEVAFYLHRPKQAIVLARALVARATAAGDLLVQARAQGTVHASAVRLRLPEEEREGALALEIAERSGDVRSLLRILSNLADAADRRAEWGRATTLYEQASLHAERGGFTLGRAVIDNNVGEILTRQGRLGEALPLFERSRTTAAAAGHWHAAFLTANIGWVRGIQGCDELAAAAFDEAESAFRSLGLLSVLPEVDRRRVAVALVQGDATRVLSHLDGSLAAEEPDDPVLLASRSHAHRQRQEWTAAREAADRAHALSDATDNAFGRLVAAEALFRLGESSRSGDIEQLSATLGIAARPVVP